MRVEVRVDRQLSLVTVLNVRLISLTSVNILKVLIISGVLFWQEVLVLTTRDSAVVLPLWVHILHLDLLILRSRYFVSSLTKVVPAVLFVLRPLVELTGAISVRS